MTPPSRVEGGRGSCGVPTEETPPPSRVSSEGGGGRWEGVPTEETPPQSRVLSEGGGVVNERVCRQKKHPPVSSEGGGVVDKRVCWQKKHPLRLAFWAREGGQHPK